MAVIVRIPTPLLSLTGGQREVQAEGSTLMDLIEDLERRYPGMKERLCDEEGNLRRFVNFFVNDEDVRFLEGAKTSLKDGDVVSIVPAIAGGLNP
ncbi:MAG: MoaD/ThiS family protein [Caldimicrobium sp.]|nr:MoaD/ThiS family protein [Caldimicrobium sp.]MCS7199747.1 MoaD/ThiS family protein [Caldimicrobium sp.]MDW8093950.1 MoaD/ThiS family protein [Caldimicrobium sp.]MDW8183370.1 MoaD/ThiS family protein [Caldimicrobium sp.]